MIGQGQSRYRPLQVALTALLSAGVVAASLAGTLTELRSRGVLRHLGVPYANFVTGSGDGLDVELVRMFAQDLGLRYEYVATTWADVIPDLTGHTLAPKGENIERGPACPVRGDIVANGMTILPWREKAVAFGRPYFPTQVWLVARADSPLAPIKPSGDTATDIIATRGLVRNHTVLGKEKSCLDPALHKLAETGGTVRLFEGTLNELAPALIQREADLTILDVPDVLIALQKWPGQLKILGPISPPQVMACAFAPENAELRLAFDAFLERCLRDGTYERLVRKYYPHIREYFPDFFATLYGKPAAPAAAPEAP